MIICRENGAFYFYIKLNLCSPFTWLNDCHDDYDHSESIHKGPDSNHWSGKQKMHQKVSFFLPLFASVNAPCHEPGRRRQTIQSLINAIIHPWKPSSLTNIIETALTTRWVLQWRSLSGAQSWSSPSDTWFAGNICPKLLTLWRVSLFTVFLGVTFIVSRISVVSRWRVSYTFIYTLCERVLIKWEMKMNDRLADNVIPLIYNRVNR